MRCGAMRLPSGVFALLCSVVTARHDVLNGVVGPGVHM